MSDGTVLAQLADAAGVAVSYEDYRHRPVAVADESVRLALAAMGIPADDDDRAREALRRIRTEREQRHLPPTIVLRHGGDLSLRLESDAREVMLEAEDGTRTPLAVDGDLLRLPAEIPLGYHRLVVRDPSGETTSHLVVAPAQCPLPLTRRGFGWMAQVYAVRSSGSWGIGDYRDLRTLGEWSGEQGADMVLVNPLHAAAPVLPQQNSPYSPTSRRYRSTLYLRPEEVAEFDLLDADDRARVAALAAQARDEAGPARIDRDAAFRAKTEALEMLADVDPAPERAAAFEQWAAREGAGLVDFATFCALAERHGVPWQDWPAALRHPGTDAVAAARGELRDRVRFHMWLQWLCDEQLRDAQDAALDAGMALGIVHDLAVGVDPGGADAWALQDELATGVTIGAPPDSFNQRGQDWALPPFLPQRLRDTGYAPFRDMVRGVLRHAGGIRIDHVMGLWRLWWVPQGRSAAEGTYVRYPADDLLGVLALEAHRAGAMVVGEDLGTVESGVRETLASQRILSSRVLYFERVDDDPDKPMAPAASYPELALTSITTHDLPTAAGWWADEDIRVQTQLGLFSEQTTPAQQQRRKAAERADMLALLVQEGLVDEEADDAALVRAMHEFLARTPSLLVATGLTDAAGDLRQPNLPGTVDEYPNWRMPLGRPDGDGVVTLWLEDVIADPRVAGIAGVLRARG